MMENIYDVHENVKRAIDQVQTACISCGRNPEEVIIMGVSKTQPIEKLQAAFDAGITIFGENRVQELVQKSEFFLQNQLSCHIIGQLQTNKVKYLPALTDTIQSVDSLKLAQEIEKQYKKADKIAKVLVEINIGAEENKGGIAPNQAYEFVHQLSEFKNLQVEGLMCVPPRCENELVRQYFSKVRQLFVDIAAKNMDNVNMHILSMGMSSDYPWAIQEGSNLVRIGRGIFGQRNYNKA